MSINQLTKTGVLPLPSATISSTQKVSTPNAGIAPSFVSTIGSKESEDQIKQAVQKIQGAVDNLAQNLRFSVDEDTGKTIIKVMDAQTEEVIRQIPTKEAVEI
ncbi:MAG: flagellar protein FlaG, partial [Pseudomonadota bacterium]